MLDREPNQGQISNFMINCLPLRHTCTHAMPYISWLNNPLEFAHVNLITRSPSVGRLTIFSGNKRRE